MKRWIFLLPVFVLISTGCFGNRVKPAEPPRILKNWTSDEILDTVSQRAGAIKRVKTLITLKVEGHPPSGFFLPVRSLQAVLWAERPSSIRLQGFNPLGGTLFDLVSKEGRLQLSVPGRSKEVQERLEEMLIREKEKSSLSSVLLDAIAGGGQPLMHPSEFSAVEQNEQEILLYQFSSNHPDGRTRLIRKYWLDRDRLLASQAVYFDSSGRPSVQLDFRNYQTIPAGEIESFWPREITATLKGKGRLAITFNEVNLNQPSQAGTFNIGPVSR